MATSVLVVDDHAGFRSFAHRLLSAAGLDVVGEAGTGREAIAASEQLRPDVVLLDIQLPDMEGFEVARILALQPAAPDVVLTSARPLSDFGRETAGADVRGFVAKADLTVAAVRALLRVRS